MTLYVKICGLTSAEAVEAAIGAGASAIGFVFAPSVREVTPDAAARLAAVARGAVEIVAVTRHPSPSLVAEIVAALSPDRLQTDAVDFAGFDLPASVRPLPVLRSGIPMPVPLPARCLYEGAASGAGALADWNEARRLARASEVVLAGGLNPGNVADAVATVGPFGVDVSSGVESSPGRKDPLLIESFVSRARAAARLLSGVDA